jgi:hypothetical protein
MRKRRVVTTPEADEDAKGIDACGHKYGSNGSDNFQRKCPSCQGGAPGLTLE